MHRPRTGAPAVDTAASESEVRFGDRPARAAARLRASPPEQGQLALAGRTGFETKRCVVGEHAGQRVALGGHGSSNWTPG